MYSHNNNLNFAIVPLQTSGTDCLFVEGASAVLPSSVAKVISSFSHHSNVKVIYAHSLITLLLFQVTLDDKKSKVVDFNIIWSSSPDSLKYSSYISKPVLIEFPTEVPGQNAYAYFYPPSNPTYRATEGEKPPLLLKSHGKYWSRRNHHSFICWFRKIVYQIPIT